MRLTSILACCSLAFALACPRLASARQVSCLQQTVHVNVLTRDGRIVTGLGASTFAGSYKRHSVLIRSVAENRGPRRVFILIDASGSMLAFHDLSFNIAEELLSDLPPGTQFAFLVFAERAIGAPEFTADRKSLRSQLETLRNERNLQKRIRKMTALFNALDESLASFGKPQEGDVFYIISDGHDNASRMDWRKLEAQILQRGIRVFAMRVHWLEGPESSPGHLADLVNSTGGYEIVLPVDFALDSGVPYNRPFTDAKGKPTRFAAAINLQLRLIMHSMDVTLQLPDPPRKSNKWQLNFADREDAKNLILTYQHVLIACGN